MQSIYSDIQKMALEIASGFAPPDFYRDYKSVCESSRVFFNSDPIVANLKKYVFDTIENDFGHGMDHVIKVTLDAGALLLIEGPNIGLKDKTLNRHMLITQCAGLLHDIKRKQKEKDHAIQGSIFVRDLFKSYPFTPEEIEDISMAIKNHEAFKPVDQLHSREANLVSDCLYDADKFRWGPDNFTLTVWDMLAYAKTPIKSFMDYYPKSIEGIARIKDTFRTPTGKKYGPRFIDLGIEMGETIYARLKETYA